MKGERQRGRRKTSAEEVIAVKIILSHWFIVVPLENFMKYGICIEK